MKAMFLGYDIEPYGIENRRVDYRTLAKAVGDMVICNDMITELYHYGYYWDQIAGYEDDCENPHEIFQYYIISEYGADILERYTDEIVYYNEQLDLYLWGITHFGTSWDYVLTNIVIDKDSPGIYIEEE